MAGVSSRRGTWRVVTGLLLFWLVVLLYMSSTLYGSGSGSSDNAERTERQLARALHELDALKQQNNELHKLAEDLKDIRRIAEGAPQAQRDVEQRLEEANYKLQQLQQQSRHTQDGDIQGPGADHEELRRKIERGEVEGWFYLNDQLAKLKEQHSSSPVLTSHIDTIIQNGVDHHRTIMADLYNLSQSDGAGLWRQQEAEEVSDLMQRRLHYLQNPSDCRTARKVVCNLNKGCGYGCQLHHLVYCLMIAYGTERTLILESRGWRYSPSGWETFFQPLSQTCTDRDGHNSRNWGPPGVIDNVQVIELPIVDSLHPRSPYMPLSIPEELAPRLMRFHGHPSVWFIGQLLKYLLRPQPDIQRDLDITMKKLGFRTPIVGVHVRRTDKVGTEAAFHSIEEYMVHVDDYYDMLEKQRPVNQRRIYLATDDPNLLTEAREKFPHYEIIGDAGISQTAGLGSRYSESSLRGIILDIHFLSKSNFLVCTFSSQVCRVAYEIMQTYHPDAANNFYSLDDIYYFGGQNAHNQEAIYEHKAQNQQEIDLNVGDLVGVAGNHWNGYSKGINRQTGKTGLYPSYKVKEFIDIVSFPKYDKVPLKMSLFSAGGDNGMENQIKQGKKR